MVRQYLGFSIAGVLMPTMAAWSQTPWFTYEAEWHEVQAGTNVPVTSPNGMLEPGEAVRLRLSASFTPVGTPVAYQQPGLGVGPVLGLLGAAFDITATDALGGVWGAFIVRHGLVGSSFNFPFPDGGLRWCGFGQLEPPPGALPDPMNPLPDVWEAVWTPDSYTPRLARFEVIRPVGLEISVPRLYALRGTDPTTGHPLFGLAQTAPPTFDAIQVSIVPAPGAGAVLGLGLALMQGRGRRRYSAP